MSKAIAALAAMAAALTAAAAGQRGAGPIPGLYQARVRGASPPALNGLWQVAFRDSAFAVSKDGLLAVRGQVRLAGSTITFRDQAGPLRCRGPQARGTYRFVLRGRALTLTPARDACPGRRLVLSRTFRKVG